MRSIVASAGSDNLLHKCTDCGPTELAFLASNDEADRKRQCVMGQRDQMGKAGATREPRWKKGGVRKCAHHLDRGGERREFDIGFGRRQATRQEPVVKHAPDKGFFDGQNPWQCAEIFGRCAPVLAKIDRCVQKQLVMIRGQRLDDDFVARSVADE